MKHFLHKDDLPKIYIDKFSGKVYFELYGDVIETSSNEGPKLMVPVQGIDVHIPDLEEIAYILGCGFENGEYYTAKLVEKLKWMLEEEELPV